MGGAREVEVVTRARLLTEAPHQVRYRTASPGPSPCECVLSEKWSQWSELNRRPTVYETVALPLSYIGILQRKKPGQDSKKLPGTRQEKSNWSCRPTGAGKFRGTRGLAPFSGVDLTK